MKEKQIQDEVKKRELAKIYAEIKTLEDKDWYGMILIGIVAILILFFTILQIGYDLIEVPLVLINSVLFIVHLILLYLSRTGKVIAYTGGLAIFIILIVLNILLSGGLYLGKVIWILAIIGSYTIFIYEAVKIKKLKSLISNVH